MVSNVSPGDTKYPVTTCRTFLKKISRICISLSSRIGISGFDFCFAVLLILSTIACHYNVKYWAGQAFIGNWQYGDAEFWWNGAIQFAEGILRDNPNLTFRMGYAITAGLWVALLGTDFHVFHVILLALYLVVWYALYLVLRSSFGRIAAAVGILLTVLNPFTAEWLAISTSDSVGLLFNTCALVFLAAGMRGDLSPGLLAGGGLFIAFSSLTRPLMTVFLVVALLLPMVAAHVNWRRRFRAMSATLVAFLIPTAIWLGIFRSVTGDWKLAGHDSSIFYAASDPNIQVWNNEMYEKVKELAKVRFNVRQPTATQVNQEFDRLTAENYRTFARHHLQRVIPHVVEIADMSIAKASRVEERSKWLRLLVLGVCALALATGLLLQRAVMRAALIVAIILTWMSLPLTSWVVLVAVASVIPLTLWNRSGWGGAILTAYWCAGVVALYFVGGTWGPPIGAITAVNALGYRLGSQFFFSADFIVLCLIHNICVFRRAGRMASEGSSSLFRSKFWNVPLPWASAAVSTAFLIWLGVICFAGMAGGAVVTYKLISRSIGTSRVFPDLTPVLQLCLQSIQKVLPSPRLRIAVDDARAILQPNENSPYVLTTGGSTDFIWNLSGQNRTKFLLSLQTRVWPFDFANRVFVDAPSFLEESEWSRRQGAWLVRRFEDAPPPSHLPWYVSDIAIRAFIPLDKNRTNYDLMNARWFPVVKYASQLHTSKELEVEKGTLEFSATSGAEQYPRRLAIRPGAEPDAGVPVIAIDAGKALGNRNLKFRWQCELTRSELPRTLTLRVQRYLENGARETPVERVEELAVASYLPSPKVTEIDLNHPPTRRLRLLFGGLRPGDTVWIYELNLAADDWEW